MTRKRNWGMVPEAQANRATPATLKQPEHTPAVPARKPARSYTVSTDIYTEYGYLLEDLRRDFSRENGRKYKIAEILEMGLEALKQQKSGSARSIGLHE